MRDLGFFARSIVVAFVSTAIVGPATFHGQATTGPAGDCANAQLEAPQRIAACTAYMNLPDADDEQIAVAYVDRGDAYDQSGNYDEAIKNYDQALQLQPDYAAAFNNRGSAQLSKKEYDRAIRDFSEAIRLSPDSGAFYRNRGAAYLDGAEFEKASDDFGHAVQLDPTSATGWADRCLIHAILDELKDAQSDCDHAQQLEGDNVSAFFSRGLLDLKSGKASAAQIDYFFVMYKPKGNSTAEPRHTLDHSFAASALYGIGIAQERRGDYQRGDRDIADAVKTDSAVAERFARWGITKPNPSETHQQAAALP
jgi:tetratricopeptide (TPR) repeat protein